MKPLFQTQFLPTFISKGAASAANDEQFTASGPGKDSSDDTSASAIIAGKISRVEQAQIAQMIGDTMVRLDRIADAVAYYESARRLESAPAVRKGISRKIASARASLRIQQQNAVRQPILHEPLEQDHLVRPQLIARVIPALEAATSKGGVKP
jgi:hypothetical protein